ncbi:HET-domain-containing protein, partial [Hyaloscypha bicolor E]
ELEEYFGSQIPKYAILSHCWGVEEVEFQHINGSEWHGMCGATKIQYASSQCKKEGLRYIWIDTCCIDKSSSAELSEAINSMYGWYEGSVVCYAYLEDVGRALSTQTSYGPSNKDKTVEESRWFTRGWTLQELIAPAKVDFFDNQWQYLGRKEDLSPLLSRITSIPEDVLTKPENRRDCSVAKKMAWAAKRQTTRIEDVAYSLFGIFDVNMPLLYGEGRGAFTRLQEEILKETDDQSLLAWGLVGNRNLDRPMDTGVFANSPDAFLGSEDVVPFPSKPRRQPHSVTNKGVRIELPVTRNTESGFYPRCEFAILDCQIKDDFSGAIGIPL